MFSIKKYVLMLFLLLMHLSAQHPELDKIYEFSDWQEHLLMGKGMINTGDLDRDGFDEYVSYSPESSSAFLFKGAFPPDTLPTLSFFEMGEEWPKTVRKIAVGNVYGDSFPELIIPHSGRDYQTYIYKLGPAQDSIVDVILDDAGNRICIGDINNDGFDDIIMAEADSLGFYTSRGRVLVYLGKDTLKSTPDYTIYGDNPNSRLGMNCITGDLNGDDFSDLIIAGNNMNISSNYDYMRIYFGSANFDTEFDIHIGDPCIEPASQGFNGQFTCFDYNQDGYEDLFTNGLYIYNGSAVFDTIPEYHFIWPGDGLNTYGGSQIFNAGDVNNDGYLDLGIGMPIMFGGKGLVHIKMGDHYGIDDDYIYIEPDYGQGFGHSLINLGDLNADTVSDIVIGEPYYILSHGYGKHTFYAGNASYKPDVRDTVVSAKKEQRSSPLSFKLKQNYPNPFNNTTHIPYTLPFPGRVSISIYNLNGRLTKNYSQKISQAGEYSLIWDGKDQAGRFMASGVYFYRLSYQSQTSVQFRPLIKKLIYLK